MQYNKSGTPFYKAALRIQASSRSILEELDELSNSHPELLPNAEDPVDATMSNHSATEPPIGDLEPTLDVLELLFSMDALQDQLNLIVEEDPLTFLFNYELARFKPPPTPPTPVSKPEKTKTKKSKSSKPKAVQRLASAGVLDSSPGFRAPRTRHAVAQALAFE